MQSLRRQIYAQQKPDYLYQEIECSLAASGETVASQCDENRHQAEYNHPADRLNDEKTQRSHSWFPRAKRFWQRQRGWHFGVMLAALSTSTVLLLNVILLITTSIVFRNGIEDGIGTAYEGHCRAVSNMATISHVFINILGTLLLGASNYTMQVISAPTRSEVNEAHAKGDWLDIGVPSFRNIMVSDSTPRLTAWHLSRTDRYWSGLFYDGSASAVITKRRRRQGQTLANGSNPIPKGRISTRRIVLWWMMAASSIPVHLIYNSVIFKTIDTNNYSVVLGNQDFLEGKDFHAVYDYYHPYTESLSNYAVGSWLHGTATGPRFAQLRQIQETFVNNYQNGSAVQNLTNAECMRNYGTEYVSGRSDVLVISTTNRNESIHDSFHVSFSESPDTRDLTYNWICPSFWRGHGQNCDVSNEILNSTTWTVYGRKVEYCLSQLQKPRCKLQFSVGIWVTVVVMNMIKVGCMAWAIRGQGDLGLMTFGDAVASFLDHPDQLSENRCFLSKSNLHKWSPRWSSGGLHSKDTPSPQPFETLFQRRWFAAASPRRWLLTLLLCLLALAATSFLLARASSLVGNYTGRQSIFDLGFGTVDPREIIQISLPSHGSVGLAASVMFANMPQLLVSFIYVSYNGLLTTMLLTYEWSRYYVRQKPLRVTSPRGSQRSTYWLHLPYKYSLPFLVACALLHWLVSESIFLVRVDEYKDGNLVNSTSEVGFSSLPILVVILLGATMVLTLVAIGFRRLASLMPVAGSCSAAISAACHPPLDDTDAAYSAVSWGAIEQDRYRLVAHCTFTSRKVCAVTSEHVYR